MGVFKRILLTPLNDGSRTDPLHYPMIDRAIWTSIEQDVGDVVTNRQSRIRRLGSLLCRSQSNLSY